MNQINRFSERRAVRITSPYAARIRAQWQAMREACHYPVSGSLLGLLRPIQTACMKEIEKLYQYDAYHSLSIEGYEVTPELIERARSGRMES